MWYIADLVGGPEDGKEYALSNCPPYLYFHFVPETNEAFGTAVEFSTSDAFTFKKHVYRHIVNGIYWYQGIE